MGKVEQLIFFLAFLFFSACSEGTPAPAQYCLVKHGAPTDKLQQVVIGTCSDFDCGAIKPGGACFEPNTLESHASFAINILFQFTNMCDLDYSRLTTTDPSYGNCHYLYIPPKVNNSNG